jgi:integrase
MSMASHDSSISVLVMRPGDRKTWTMYFVDPLTGKRVRRSTGTTQRRGAERNAAAWEKELNEGGAPNAPRLTWAEFRDRYDAEKLAGMSPRTGEAVDTAFNHLERLIAPQYLRGINEAVIGQFVARLRQERMRETTIASHLVTVRAALRWAAKHKLLSHAPHVEIPKAAKGRTMMRGRAVAEEEFERMLMAADKCRHKSGDVAEWKRFLHGLWLSGLRLGEAISLSWDDSASFFVDLSGKRPRFRIYAEGQKARRDEYLPMTPDFARLLLETPVDRRQGRVFALNNYWNGKPMAAKSICKAIGKIGKRAGVITKQDPLEYATAHDLRRSFGKRWSLRVKPVLLQQLMRHRNLDTTTKYYVDHDADDISELLWQQEAAGSQNGSQSLNGPTRQAQEPKQAVDAITDSPVV